MKKAYILSAVFAALSLNLPAQTVNGGVGVSDAKVSREGNSILLEMALDIPKEIVTKYQSMAITPIITNGTEEARFPYVLVNGKNKSRMYKRKEKFDYTRLIENPPAEVVDVDRKYKGGTVDYSAGVVYEPWMDNASVNVEYLVSSCAGASQRNVANIVMAKPAKEVPAIVPVVEPTPELAPVHYISGTAYLDFPVGSSDIIHSYKNNRSELQSVDDALSRLKNNPKSEITGLTVTGYASPDGRYTENEKLAHDRAISFVRHIQSRYNIPIQFSNVKSVAEDWETFRKMVADSNLANKNEILSIIDGTAAFDAKESQLRRLDGGNTWKALSDTILPRLRRVDYRVDYKLTE
jgi:hypothetical protein